MFLNFVIIVFMAAFVGLAVLGHFLLLGDAWRFWGPAKQEQRPAVSGVVQVPAE